MHNKRSRFMHTFFLNKIDFSYQFGNTCWRDFSALAGARLVAGAMRLQVSCDPSQQTRFRCVWQE